MEVRHWSEELGKLFEGRRVILTGGPLAALTGTADKLRELGAQSFVLGVGTGTGTLPDADTPHHVLHERPTASMMDEVRAGEEAVRHLPADARRALDAFDPDGTALIVPSIFNEAETLAGRATLYHRPAAWVALEDKVVIDRLWDDLGVPRAPSVVVPVDRLPMVPLNTVWAGDARDGWHGGASLVRWVRQAADREACARELAAHCDSVRVMPFLEGVPCSIHGIVFADHVVVLRPVEMMVLRRPGPDAFFYCGAATYWDPPAARRDEMRAVARSVGAGLRARVGYRGAFTIDGVMAADGFRPTELNPRIGAGINAMARAIADIPLTLLAMAAAGGHDLDYRPAELEEALVERADGARGGGVWRVVDTAFTESATVDVDEPPGQLTTGPSGVGGFFRFTPGPTTPVGPSFAPIGVAALAWARRHAGIDLGPLEPAHDVDRL